MRSIRFLGTGALVLGVLAATAATAVAAPPQTCSGDLSNFPAGVGVLSGTYPGNVQVSGACVVNAGAAVVQGNLTVLPGATLIAAFGSGSLTVNGNVLVQSGGTLILGCIPTSFPCLDEPGDGPPSLSSHGVVGGNLVATQSLGVIVHDTAIRGNVSQTGGGGGVSCGPPDGPPPPGIFGLFGFPPYTDYEDDTIGGGLGVTGLGSCWLGMARDVIGGSLRVIGNQLADPDAVEILANTVSGNLICQQNSMVWDSADLGEDLYPRFYEPNTVGGNRIGQCVAAPAIDAPGGPSPGPF